jgi:hypothetical protein
MKRFAVIGTGLAAAAMVGGCAHTVYVPAATPSYTATVLSRTASPWQDPAFFRARVEQRLDDIEQRMRADVASGALAPQNVEEFEARRGQIEEAVIHASAKGYINASDRMFVRDLMQAAATPMAGAPGFEGSFGGGPGLNAGVFPYFESSWDWGL